MASMLNEKIEVISKFTMLPSGISGWTTPISSGLRPNHNFLGSSDMFFGEITTFEDEAIYPGEEKIVRISFILTPELKEIILVGFKWKIQAGSQHFANGEILELIYI